MPSPPRSDRRGARTPHRTLIALGWLAAAPGALLLALGAFPHLQLTHALLAAAAALIPYGTLAWLTATTAWLASRSWPHQLAAILTAAALAVHVSWTTPYWPHTAPEPAASEPTATELTVLTANLYYGRADVTALEALVSHHAPDVLVLQEVPAPALARIRESDIGELLPHEVSSGQAAWGAEGAAILSRHPLEQLPVSGRNRGVRFVVHVAHPTAPFTVVAVHTTNPLLDVTRWRTELDDLAGIAATAPPGPLVIAGDFNATREHEPLRRLLSRTGLEDAAEQAGAGWLPTFPADWLPLVGLDHVLVGGGVTAHDVRTVLLPGSDHRGLVARLAVGPAASAATSPQR